MPNQEDIVIDHDKPMPARRAGRAQMYPYRQMQVGDSIFVTQAISTQFWELVTGHKFVKRKVIEDGVEGTRVWCMAKETADA